MVLLTKYKLLGGHIRKLLEWTPSRTPNWNKCFLEFDVYSFVFLWAEDLKPDVYSDAPFFLFQRGILWTGWDGGTAANESSMDLLFLLIRTCHVTVEHCKNYRLLGSVPTRASSDDLVWLENDVSLISPPYFTSLIYFITIDNGMIDQTILKYIKTSMVNGKWKIEIS